MLLMAPKYRPLEISSNLRCGALGRPGASPGTSMLGRSASRFSRSESPTRQPLARRRRQSWPRQLWSCLQRRLTWLYSRRLKSFGAASPCFSMRYEQAMGKSSSWTRRARFRRDCPISEVASFGSPWGIAGAAAATGSLHYSVGLTQVF